MAQRTKPVKQQLAELRKDKNLGPPQGKREKKPEGEQRNPRQRSELQEIASKATFLKRRVSAAFAALRDATMYVGGKKENMILFSAIDNLDDQLANLLDEKTEQLRSEAVRRQLAAGAKVVTTRKPRSRRA